VTTHDETVLVDPWATFEDPSRAEITARAVEAAKDARARTPALEFQTIAEACAEVDNAGPRRFLIRGIWPAGVHGVHAAEMKAQKTWNGCDLAVSVASETDWLGAYPIDDSGSVIFFIGEGGKPNIIRRLRSICASRGLRLEDLPIWLCVRSPRLQDAQHMALFEQQVQIVRPKLVILDPLYLSVGSANGTDLSTVGQVLEKPQHVCEVAGAALFVVTHTNRKEGRGASRITGAGPAEWGRVLIVGTVTSKATNAETLETTVVTELDIAGGEVPERMVKIRRRIYSDDPDDLDSPLHYSVEALAVDAPTETSGHGLGPAADKLLEAMAATGGGTGPQLVDAISARHGHGLTRQTVSEKLNALESLGQCVGVAQGSYGVKHWTVSSVSPDTVSDTADTAVGDGVVAVASPIRGDTVEATPFPTLNGSRSGKSAAGTDGKTKQPQLADWSARLGSQYGTDQP
jgi:AAA domain